MDITRRDALRGAAAVAATGAVLPIVTGIAGEAAAVPTAPLDDAGLLDLWELRQVLLAKVNDRAIPDDESDRYFDQFSRVTDVIVAAPIATPTGIALKLRIAVEYGELNEEVVDHPIHVMPHAVINALAAAERLAGSVPPHLVTATSS